MAPALLAAIDYVDWSVFVVSAAVIIWGAFGVIFSRNPVHAALNLVMTLFGIAVLFVAQEAHFLAAVQIIVYAGAIVVLFLFVIMLIGVDQDEEVQVEPLGGQRPLAFGLGALILLMVLFLARSGAWVTGASRVGGAAGGPGENVAKLGRAIFTTHLLAFELTAVLLVIAVVGAVVLARRAPRGEAANRATGPGGSATTADDTEGRQA